MGTAKCHACSLQSQTGPNVRRANRYGLGTTRSTLLLHSEIPGEWPPLNFSLRHEVARLIVWHDVQTRPVVGAADKAARLMRCKSSVVNCLVRTTSIFGTCAGNNTG